MEVPTIKNKCDPCKCRNQISSPVKSQYFSLEESPTKEKTSRKKPKSRPSSASSVKSSRSETRKSENSAKITSSDSKIIKKSATIKAKVNLSKNKEEHKSKRNSENNVQQLKEDLKIIKEQLVLLTKNRNEALNVTNELEVRYIQLLNKSQNQEKEIIELRNKNNFLLESLKSQETFEELSDKDVAATKICLDQYEEKLNALYNEFLGASKIMDQSKEQVCNCINHKNHEFQKMANSEKELAKMIQDNNIKYANLLKYYQSSKENESRYLKENEELTKTIEQLQKQLHQTMMQLEKSHQETLKTVKKQHEETNKKNKSYSYELQLKEKEISELNSALEELRTHICQYNNQKLENNMIEAKYEQLHAKYKQVMDKVNIYEQKNKERIEEMQMMKKNQNELVTESARLQNCIEKLTSMSNGQNLTIAQLTTSNQEKDSIIQCQKAELASKNKHIELLLKNEDRLKKRTVQLQEDLVSMRISSNSEKTDNTTVLCAEDGSIHLTDELQDLITALYEEIDKTLAKDDQIQKQNRIICCLQCVLSSKEKELICVRNELKIIRDQVTTTLREKQVLVEHLKKIEDEYLETEEEPFCEQCYGQISKLC